MRSGIGKAGGCPGADQERDTELVSDDVVEIRKVGDDTLVGTAPDITKHFIELRGIGIIDVKALFRVSSVMDTTNISLVIRVLEDWDKEKKYDRLGLEENYTEYLGNKVKYAIISQSDPDEAWQSSASAQRSNHRQEDGL